MIGGDAIGQLGQPALPQPAQARQHMALLVLVVMRGGDVEVAQHIARRVAGLGVGAVQRQVVGQAQQERQAAFDAFVAGRQHVEGFVETDRRAGVEQVHANSPKGWWVRAVATSCATQASASTKHSALAPRVGARRRARLPSRM